MRIYEWEMCICHAIRSNPVVFSGIRFRWCWQKRCHNVNSHRSQLWCRLRHRRRFDNTDTKINIIFLLWLDLEPFYINELEAISSIAEMAPRSELGGVCAHQLRFQLLTHTKRRHLRLTFLHFRPCCRAESEMESNNLKFELRITDGCRCQILGNLRVR